MLAVLSHSKLVVLLCNFRTNFRGNIKIKINMDFFQDELEEDVQKEVDKILSELTLDTGAKMARAPLAPEASIVLPEPGSIFS